MEVDKLATEVKAAIRKWFAALQKSANAAKAANVERNLRWLAKEKPKVLPPGRVTSGTIVRYTTSSTGDGVATPPTPAPCEPRARS